MGICVLKKWRNVFRGCRLIMERRLVVRESQRKLRVGVIAWMYGWGEAICENHSSTAWCQFFGDPCEKNRPRSRVFLNRRTLEIMSRKMAWEEDVCFWGFLTSSRSLKKLWQKLERVRMYQDILLSLATLEWRQFLSPSPRTPLALDRQREGG